MLFDVALMAPGVHVNPKLRDLAADLLEHVLDGIAAQPGELVDVLALVAAFRRLLPTPARLDGRAEQIDLAAGVVEVVLALDLVAREREHARDRVAVGAVSRRADCERPRGVRRDQLHLDLLPLVRIAGSVLRVDLPERSGEPGVRHPEIEEARACHLRPLDLVELRSLLRQVGSQLARRALVLRGGAERDVRRVVAVGRIARALELDRRACELAEPRREPGDRIPGRVRGASHARSIVGTWTTRLRSDSSTSTWIPSRWPAPTQTSRTSPFLRTSSR